MITAPTLAALGWLAFGGAAEATAADRFEPSLHRQLAGFEDVDVDSGWVPANAPVQLRLQAHAADSIRIEMLGEATYDWDAQTIAFAGDPMGGLFAIDVGLELQASVRFDVAGWVWESDLLGPWDYAIISDALFTPYLLPGNPQRPVEIQDQTGEEPVVSIDVVPDIVVASGTLDISVSADVTASLAGVRIEATTAQDGALVDQEGVPSPLSPDPGADPLAVEGVMVADLQTETVLTLRPHLVMTIVGMPYEIVGIDIPVALPPVDDTLIFDPESMAFDAPEPPPEPGTSASGGVDDTAGDDSPPASDDTTGGSGTGSDEPGGAPTPFDGGCGCRGTGPGGPGA
ncbi:MAG: hypothetical protein KDK70_15940, partial [Myxococcales bacterium]|nr:hypothetical protein [Myxococcales bacterium]